MNDQSAYLMRAITGPIVLITIGVLFAFDRFTQFRFSQTWPVLLIVFGLLKLLGGGGKRGWSGRYPPPPPPGPPPPPNFGDRGARP
jgi:LiaI-LiaF-like transmembrane region